VSWIPSLVNLFRRDADYLVGLDVGTSRIKVAVGQERPDGALSMIGRHMTESEGIRKGEVQDQKRACDAIARALREAEENFHIGMELVELAITGAHIAAETHTGHVGVRGEGGEVNDADVQAAKDSASSCAQLGSDRTMIHVVQCGFDLDGGPPLVNPVGHLGNSLKAEVHCIHGHQGRVRNLPNCLCSKVGANVEVNEVVFSGLASALAVLEPEDKQMGAIVIDLGGGITEYVVYRNGAPRLSGTLAVGGEHMVNDLMVGLGIRQRNKARKLLHEAGGVMVEPEDRGREVVFSRDEILGARQQVYFLDDIHRILHERMDETLRIIRDRIFARNASGFDGVTVFLTGGCARLKGMVTLAQSIFDLQAKTGIPTGFEGQEDLRSPEMATAVGLVKYAHAQRLAATKRKRGMPNLIGRILED